MNLKIKGDCMDQSQTPLFDQLIKHIKGNPISFHVPGHKYGNVVLKKGQFFFDDILKLDATELSGLDDLHSPEGVILEAENLLSNLFCTQKSYFLINGSTVGNLSMILAALREDERVLVQRNSHKSIMNGIKLAKARPVFISPEYDMDYGVAGGLSLSAVKEAIKQHPDAKALILTYPNYYGLTYDLKSIIDEAHEHGIPVLVDEAHGVHFIAGDYFPESAVTLGADIVVQSAHKTLPAMTMAAYLHFQSSLISRSRLEFYLQALQSSSPSYPLMASLDIARSYLGTYNIEDLDFLQKEIESFRNVVQNVDKVDLLKANDPLKMTLSVRGRMSGFKLQSILESHGIFTELADPYNVLFVLPLLKKGMSYMWGDAAEKLARAASEIPKEQVSREQQISCKKAVSTLAVSYKEMESQEIEAVELEASIGRICAESIIPYPPGIPLCLPGEALREDDIQQVTYLKKVGAKIQGGEQLDTGKIIVFKSWRI
jgi:arginine/lysine/ornithine decarboxylase